MKEPTYDQLFRRIKALEEEMARQTRVIVDLESRVRQQGETSRGLVLH